MAAYLRRLYEHLAWADARTVAALRAMHAPPLDALRLLSHVIGAEHVWLSRIEGRPGEVPVWPSFGLEECVSVGLSNHSAFAALVETVTPTELQREIHYRNSKDEPFTNTLEDILLHVSLHGSYHRGQVARIIRTEGGVPLYTDYIRFVREVFAHGRS
jgi:uncharacterized damage-inducible protein DinB